MQHDHSPEAARGPDAEASPASAWYALFVLTVLLIFATIDRAVISLLAEPIKKTFGLTDFQLGLMQGTGIAIFTALAAFPLAWLADRYGRRVVLAGCVMVWSLAVVSCGFAQTYPQMLLATAMVGAGEAGLGPITYTLIAEMFRGNRRQTANSTFVVATAAGGGAAMVITGQIVGAADAVRPLLPMALQSLESWRISFLMAALPAPPMILLIATIRQVRRVPEAASQAVASAVTVSVTLRQHFAEHGRTLFLFFFGVGMAIFSFAAVGSWIAVICMRLFSQTAVQVGNAQAAIGLGAIGIGFLITTLGMRFLAPRLGNRLQVRTMWVSTLLATSTAFSMSLATSAEQVYMIQAVQAVLLTAANMLYPTALQSLAPTYLLGRVVAIQSGINVLMAAIASPTVGFLSDQLSHRPDGLLIAASGAAVVGLLASTVLLRLCERSFAQTVDKIARDASEAQPSLRPEPA
jgi:MFS family permease